MSGLGDVFGSLKAMSFLQLLFAFVACTAYALGQGSLVSSKARRFAWGMAVVAAFGFVFESSEWMQAAMLLAFAMVGMGVFVMTVWLTSLAIGFHRARVYPALDGLNAEVAAVQHSRTPSSLHGDHAHSI